MDARRMRWGGLVVALAMLGGTRSAEAANVGVNQPAEDSLHASGDEGLQFLAVRKDAGAALADTDGDYTPLQVDSSGNLRVNLASGGAGDGKLLDGTAAGQADVLGTAPAGTEQALVVRNIPSGTQTVSGTVTTATPEEPTYVAAVFASAAAANKDHLHFFNAAGSGKVIKVRKIKIAPEFAAAVSGLAQAYRISRTSTAGATCTAVTIALVDTNNAAVPAQVTSSTNCTTDPTISASLLTCAVSGDETHAMDPEGICYKYMQNGGQPITLREGQGLMVKSSALSGAYPVSISIEFTM